MNVLKPRVGRIRARLVLALALCIFVFSAFSVVIPQPAIAQTPTCGNGRPIPPGMTGEQAIEQHCNAYAARWIDRTHIEVYAGNLLRAPRIYTDTNLDSDTYNWKDLSGKDECESEIWMDHPSDTRAQLIIVTTDRDDQNCQLRWASGGEYEPGEVVLDEDGACRGRPLWDAKAYRTNCETIDAGGITIGNAGLNVINFRFTNEDTIEKVDGTQTLTRTHDDTFVEDADSCGDSIILDGTEQINGQTVRTGTYRERKDGDDGCETERSQNAYVTSAGAPGDEDNDPGGGAEPRDSCESAGALGWIMCPVINAIDGALNWVDTQIQALLSIDANYYTNENLKDAFANIRNVAYIILIPVMLVMVIGTALSFDFVSAYTVKRALPRMIVAIIFIALSYQIGVFLIEFFNELGSATLGLITAPFADGSAEVNLKTLFEGGFVQGILTGIIAVPGLIIAIWLFGGTLLLFAASAFLVLLLRQIFIIVFLLAAPLAILAWIFPGNDKLWKLWWGSFSKLLLMYPLIMAIIAVGRIFAFTIHSANPAGLEGSILKPIMILVAYMIPYAFIPFTFKFAGGIFATFSGMVNDKSKGLFDRQKEKRAEKIQRAKSNNAFKNAPEGSLRSGINTAMAGALNANKSGVGLNPNSWRPSRIRGNLSSAIGTNSINEAAENAEKNADYQSWKGDDDLNRAAAESRDEAHLREILADRGYANGDQAAINMAAARVERTRKTMSNSGFRQMTTLSAIAGGTAYEDSGEMAMAIAQAGMGDAAATANLVAKGRSAAMAAGRVDQGGAGFGDTFAAVNDIQQQLGNLPADPGQAQQVLAQAQGRARDRITGGAINSQGGMGLAGAQVKRSSVRNAIPHMRQRLEDAKAQGEGAYARELARVANIYDAMSNTSPQNAEELADGLLGYRQGEGGQEVRDAQGNVTIPAFTGARAVGSGLSVQQDIDSVRNRPEFLQMRREYRSEIGAGAAGGGPPPEP